MAGSPPRAWGQRRWPRSSCRGPRFTPTRVGTTSSNFLSRSAWAVHPHARGDNPPNRAAKGGIDGSPPRAWGQLAEGVIAQAVRRFTPTRVGTTLTKLLILRHANEKKALEVIDDPSCLAAGSDSEALFIVA